jgi:hydrogenase-4 membrane subunit HyfE
MAMPTDLMARFVIGGVMVSAFSLVGSLFKPASFAGLFGAAPSIALATLGLTLAKEGSSYASTECRSMIVGAAAFGLYAVLVSWLLLRFRLSALKATLLSLIVWFAVAFGLWTLFLRPAAQ